MILSKEESLKSTIDSFRSEADSKNRKTQAVEMDYKDLKKKHESLRKNYNAMKIEIAALSRKVEERPFIRERNDLKELGVGSNISKKRKLNMISNSKSDEEDLFVSS